MASIATSASRVPTEANSRARRHSSADNITVLRFVALCHFAYSATLLAAAVWFGASALSVLPHMSSGTPLTNLPAVLLIAATIGGPPAALAIWMAVLGRVVWRRLPDARAALLWTHSVLLVAGAVACAIGIAGMEAAARSSERGGGLLGPVAVLPLFVGLPMVALALCSIAVAVTALQSSRD